MEPKLEFTKLKKAQRPEGDVIEGDNVERLEAPKPSSASVWERATAPEPRSRRKKVRETNPTVQMSVRMREDIYERFREMSDAERRTNGDMLEHLMNSYEKALKAGVVSRF